MKRIWYKYDDDKAIPMKNGFSIDDVIHSPYVLFYRKTTKSMPSRNKTKSMPSLPFVTNPNDYCQDFYLNLKLERILSLRKLKIGVLIILLMMSVVSV